MSPALTVPEPQICRPIYVSYGPSRFVTNFCFRGTMCAVQLQFYTSTTITITGKLSFTHCSQNHCLFHIDYTLEVCLIPNLINDVGVFIG
jgi:hypothetical protein